MKILIMEDDDPKYDVIRNEIEPKFIDAKLEIIRAECMADATKAIYQSSFDLIIVDLMMPTRMGDVKNDVSEEVIGTIENSGINTSSNVIAMTSFANLATKNMQAFVDAGIIIIHYDVNDDAWKSKLSTALAKIEAESIFSFVIVCALEKERQAYKNTSATVLETKNIRGFDCMLLEVNGEKGVCIKAPRAGLVDSAIITARALERFRPNYILMSGICAGVAEEADLGTLIVADMCWEYQTGKWTGTGFKMEPYGVQLENDTKIFLSQMIQEDTTGKLIKKGLPFEELRSKPIILGPVGSGSAVISDAKKMIRIGNQHRKMAGVEMEMYAIYQAAQLSDFNPIFFGAKVVSDQADDDKSDAYQEYGSTLSARFIIEALTRKLSIAV